MPQTEQTYYLRIQTGGSLQLPLYLWSPTMFAKEHGDIRHLHGAYYGIMLAMILYNMFLFLFVQDRNYLYYIVYISSFLLLQASINGYTQFYLWPDNPWWANRSVPFFVGLVSFFAINFSRQFLTTRATLPRTDWLLKGLMLFSVLIMLGALILPHRVNAPIANAVAVILPVLLLPAGYLSLRAGYRPARFYIIAWSMLLLGIFITSLMFTGLLPRNPITTYAMQAGSALEVILLSIALADRINILRQEKAAAQLETTEALQRLNEDLETQVAQRTQELARHAGMLEQTVAERTADLRRSNEKLSRAMQAKDSFLANMSHELRTPLTGILGLSEIMSLRRSGPLNEQQERYLGIIRDSGNHLLALIDDILDVARIESEVMTLDPDWVPVEGLCRASLAMIGSAAEKKDQTVRFEADSIAKSVWADEKRLKQILVNLLGNAVKFTPSSGNIGLSVRADAAERCICFTVWDTGHGIPEQDMERLFKPFVQLDGTFSRRHEGSGLGLSLVYKLTELHGGSVTVESEVAQGSRFTVRLAWSSEDQAQAATDDSPSDDTTVDTAPAIAGSVSVLLAEDNEVNLITLCEFLSREGCTVMAARNGAEAVQVASNTRPDIIIMDIQMPELDGLAAIRRIRSMGHLTGVPIIALTALAMPGDKERCLEAGSDRYLSKPVKLGLLLNEISALLNP